MALVKCKECGKEISTEAKSCPSCGAKPPARTSVFTWVIGGIVAIGAISAVFHTSDPTSNSAPTAPASSTTSSTIVSSPDIAVSYATPELKALVENQGTAKAAPQAQRSKWRYSEDSDKMSAGKYRFAMLDSENTLNFSFPYGGRNQPTITLRKNPHGRLDASIQVDKGQFICSVSGCSVLVKFDDKPAVRFSASEPSDHSTTVLFISPSNKFLSGLRSARRTNIEATFYQEGNQVMTFDPIGLEWK